jgi:hypothetical protein
MRVGVDLDGCLVDFNAGYRRMLGETTGRWLIPDGDEPPCWNYATEYGYTKEEDAEVWRRIRNSREFWKALDPLPGAASFVDTLGRWVAEENWSGDARLEVYFITTRDAPRVKQQSERWLMEHGWFGGVPTVLIARGSKGDLARGLKLDSVVDDRPENLFDIRKAVRSCQTIKRQARYNLWADEGPESQLITHRVETVEGCLPIWRDLYARG